jgi:hypothetical protein
LKEQFIKAAIELSFAEADFFSGNRKILSNRQVVFDGPLLDDFAIEDCGFTKMKMSLLKKGYVVQDAIDAAVMLWELRKEKSKYGSVAFHCYNHLLKNDPTKTSKRGSTMGPCIQAVVLTWIPGRKRQCDGWTDITVFYRTTEFFKKFPADLILLRDVLLPNFDFTDVPIRRITFNFAGITIHPMYFTTIVPHMKKPIMMLEDLREEDPHFWDWIVKWTSRYICPEYEHSIKKFEQGKRVGMDAKRRIDPKVIKLLQKYVRKHHSGFRGAKK